MFRETLLESSPGGRTRKRWPMAIAFVLESIAAALVIIVPLLSTGVIPVSAGFRCPTLLPTVTVENQPTHVSGGHSSAFHTSPLAVVPVITNSNAPYFGPARLYSGDRNVNPNIALASGGGPSPDLRCDTCESSVKPSHEGKPFVISHLSEAQLIHRVEPVYPRTAVLINLQGEVKLHAIIAKDGTVQSLSVTSGHPILAQAAVDAVRQWRYRPYVLNGEAVEVETLITVNFRKDR